MTFLPVQYGSDEDLLFHVGLGYHVDSVFVKIHIVIWENVFLFFMRDLILFMDILYPEMLESPF